MAMKGLNKAAEEGKIDKKRLAEEVGTTFVIDSALEMIFRGGGKALKKSAVGTFDWGAKKFVKPNDIETPRSTRKQININEKIVPVPDATIQSVFKPMGLIGDNTPSG